MSRTDDRDPRSLPADDPRLVAALEEYLAELEAGRRPGRQEFLARHPRLAAALADCLDGLEVMHRAAPPRPAGAAGEALPLGDFRILREVGRGGMGVVYEAEQLSLGRRVALKVLPFASALDPKQLQRFKHEAQAAACLHHPNVVPVYAVGCERGVHFYAMQFIDGQSLASAVEELRRLHRPAEWPATAVDSDVSVSLVRMRPAASAATARPAATFATGRTPADREYARAVARLGVQAAEALEYAHQLGVVHRDVKPANLLLDARGNLWVTDFGLAQIQGQAGLTLTGDLLGTLRYMSPEQALGKRGLVDHRTDVYSLGATLYELLTLHHVLDGCDREELLHRIATEDPCPLRRKNPAAPAELETVVGKALAKNPEERYATAQELADDLRRFLDDKPVLARRPTLGQRARKWARRHRPLAGGLAVSLALALAGAALGTVVYALQQRHLAAERAEFALEKEKTRQQTAESLFRALLGRSTALRHARQPGYRRHVWADLRAAAALDVPGKDLGAVRAEVLACLGDPIGLEPLAAPSVVRAARAPQPAPRGARGQMCAGAVSRGRAYFALAWPGDRVELFDRDRDHEAEVHSQLGTVHDLTFTPDSKLLVAGCEEGVAVWTVPDLTPHACFRGGTATSVAAHPGGRWVATAGRQLELWSVVANRPVAAFPAPAQGARVEFSADGRYLLAVVAGQVVAAWSVRSTPEKLSLDGHQGGVPRVAFSPDGRRLASVSKDHTLKIWNAETGELLHACKGHKAAVEAVAYSPDGRLLAAGDSAGDVRLWDAGSGKELARCGSRERIGQVWRLQFGPGGQHLFAGGERGVLVWEVRREKGRASVDLKCWIHTQGVLDLAVHPEGKELAFVRRAGTMHAFAFGVDDRSRVLDVRCRPEVRALNFDAAGERLTFVTDEGKLGTWDWRNGRPAGRAEQSAFQVALSPDGRWAATPNSGRGVVVLDRESGREALTLPPEAGDVWGLAWSADGTRLAVGLSDGGLAVWDLEKVRAALAEFGIDVPSTASGARRPAAPAEAENPPQPPQPAVPAAPSRAPAVPSTL